MPLVECGCGKTYDEATQSVQCPDHLSLSEQQLQAATQTPDSDGTTQPLPNTGNRLEEQGTTLTVPTPVPPDATVQESETLAFNGGNPAQ